MQIGSLIRRAARQFKDAPCLVQDGRTLSYAEFDAATDRLGNALLARGLTPGDRVGVLLPNCMECIIAYYALAKAGLVRVGMNTRETIDDHSYKLTDSQSRAVIHAGSDEMPVEMAIPLDELKEMIATGDPAPCEVVRALDAPYRMGYTGGTTGKPKAVTLTERGELSELSAFLTDLIPDIREGDTFLHAAPIAHASGAFFLPALVRGARSLTMTKFDAEQFIGMAQAENATLTFLVPTMLSMILAHPDCEAADFDFRRIAYGASPIAESVLRRAEARFGKIFAQSYGQAESPMVITCLKPEDHDRIGSCGRPFTIVEVRVLDDDDNEVPVGETGEICCRGPQTMAYYWNRPEATEKTFRNGWLHTGDVGRMDEDGFFYILDRKNDMLISGGYNVYPREVEDVLLEVEGVVEAAVIGLPDETWGDRVYAVVSGAAGLDPDAVLAHAKRRLAGHKCPKGVEVWPDLPKSGAGKILRRKVRDELIAHARSKEMSE
ncbi:class I adenylate-forming enzyme family protein [Antarcticimicrobium luteum]|uniref:Fatty-acid--CoA ligase n=1 Tax=Antarcticimicrobium luteum TaxID=2547397 RepID=A0A4R5V2N9_9RHOB|nr:AMP-binding protein [Antarcticimicrobium luteum]TDK45706.1 fatty-acid--CoA ligase [Antarcticimicrobium luteum]